MKLCKNCKHYLPGKQADEDRCGKEQRSATHLVRGGDPDFAYCDIMREFSSKCGNEAQWFEPKEPA